MSVATPVTEISPQQLSQLKAEVAAAVRAEAQKASPGKTIIVRDLTPADFSAVDPDAQFVNQVNMAAADTYYQACTANPTLDDDEVWGIFGMAARAAIPSVCQTRFSVGAAQLLAQFHLEWAHATGEQANIFMPPVYYYGGEIMAWEISASAVTAANAEVIILLGLVGEPSGKSISPR